MHPTPTLPIGKSPMERETLLSTLPSMSIPAPCIVIIQARMTSSRLPGKVLLDLHGEPMLGRVVERARRARLIAQDAFGVVVATTTDPSDDPIEQFCAGRGYFCTRGSLHDVLDRYYQSVLAVDAARGDDRYRGDDLYRSSLPTLHSSLPTDIIVRITADCPLVDPALIDLMVQVFCDTGADFAADRLPPPWGRSIPIGLDIEVVSRVALERAWREADQPFQREHVMPYFYEGIPSAALLPPGETLPLLQGERGTDRRLEDVWSVAQTISPRGFHVAQLHHRHSEYGAYRWTVDTPADLQLLRAIYARLNPSTPDFSWMDVLTLFESDPSLAQINRDVPHKTAFDTDHRR